MAQSKCRGRGGALVPMNTVVLEALRDDVGRVSGSNSVGHREGRLVWSGLFLAVDAPAAFGLWSVSVRKQDKEPVEGPRPSPPCPPAPIPKARMVLTFAAGG